MRFLDHKLGEVIEHVFQCLGLAAVVGLDVGEDRGAAGIEFDDRRDVAIDALVIGDAGTRRVDNRDAPRSIDIENARHAEHRGGIEDKRIQEGVVDAAVKHVDAFKALRCFHHQCAVAHHQVDALDKLDAHLIGEERMLEVSAVVGARCQ